MGSLRRNLETLAFLRQHDRTRAAIEQQTAVIAAQQTDWQRGWQDGWRDGWAAGYRAAVAEQERKGTV